MNDERTPTEVGELHAAATALRAALVAWLGDLVPPYADEVLLDLQEATAKPQLDIDKLCLLVEEAESVMEMLPCMPAEWEPVHRAAHAAGLAPAK